MSADAAVLVVPDSATVAFAAMAFVAATLLYNGAFWRVSVQWSKSLTYGMAVVVDLVKSVSKITYHFGPKIDGEKRARKFYFENPLSVKLISLTS